MPNPKPSASSSIAERKSKPRLASDLLVTARMLASAGGKRKPKQANLRRAVSTAYYALFHTVCRSCADNIVASGGDFPRAAWRRAYRALGHGFAKAACNPKDGRQAKILARYPNEIQDFATQFYNMQVKRHLADYDPYARFSRSAVTADIQACEAVIRGFRSAPLSDRRAFTTLVLFQDR